ncbi:MAG: 30S ribosomal protein S16 [Phycisphaeraceae bacterium]|nr:30S ribosomal protein S16 [Phycisphaeraceae bacterium]
MENWNVVRLRLKRMGRRNRPFYRVCAIDKRAPRDGRAIEELGFYDPIEAAPEKALQLNAERVNYWLSKGAQPSQTVRDLIRKAGITPATASEPATSA